MAWLRLLVLRVNRLGQSRAQRFRLKQPFALIGAHPNATLQLNDPQVQRKHAFLQVIGGNLFCLDLGSRSGIHWPDGPRAAGWLQPTETLTIGPFQIRLDDSDNLSPLGPRSESPLERRFPPLSPDGELLLEFRNGQQKLGQCRLTRQLSLVGRTPLCRVRLGYSSISNFHAGLLQNAQGLWVIDLLSRNGMLVNGKRQSWARLEEGDRLQVGEIEMQVGSFVSIEPPMGNDQASRPFLLPSTGPSATDSPSPPLSLEPQILPVPASAAQSVVSTAVLGQVLQHLSLMQQQTLDQFQEQMQVMVQMFDSLYRDRRDELDHLRNVTRELQGLQEMLAKSLSGGAAAPLTTPPSTNGSLPLPTPLPPRPDRSMPDGTAQPAASAPPEALPTEAIHGWLNERIAILQQERQTCWQKIMHSLGL